MYKEYQGLNLPEIDRKIQEFWKKEDIFKKSVSERSGKETYVFYEGPPSANGMPGIHHVMSRTVKDLFCRFHTMIGKKVERKGGWDTHGLPVELKVEKELGITKEDIGRSISIAEYNEKCRETVMRYKDQWDDITRKMGFWVDLQDPYITFKNEYIETVWWLLKQLFDKGLMYKGYTIQPYSPAAGTGLSSHELNMPGTYRDVKDISAVAQFKLVRNQKSSDLYAKVSHGEIYFLAWTTTPWTLPSNTALAVGKKITYVLLATYNPYTNLPVNLILAQELLPKWFSLDQSESDFDNYQAGDKLIPYKTLTTFTGKELELLDYEQLLPYADPEDGEAFKVLIGDFVSTEEGTGIVHIAPSFGADDMQIAKKYGIGSLTLVDSQGKFLDNIPEIGGRFVKNYQDEEDYENVDIDIVTILKKDNKLFNSQKYSHNYPHCWRTDKPILYYPLDSWFIRSSAMRERMLELNDQINWKPSYTGEKRFANWLENLQDWNLSRSRFWGTPLPIWRTSEGDAEICIGSIDELSKEIVKANQVLGLNQTVPQDLHRPYIDEIILASDDGKEMKREIDLIDVWFDSGSMPYAQWHYPFENQEIFKQNFPADFIAEGVDQTRGWFFTLHAIATMVFDSVSFKNVVSNGLVQDKLGRKMSKRLGNTVDPFDTIEKFGADATRWYMISNAQPWDNLKFDLAGVDEVRRKFFGTLYNTYSFFALYANIDQFKYEEDDIPLKDRPEIDQWIVSKLHSLIKEVNLSYRDYEPTFAARSMMTFVDAHLSNWYVRLCRRRFWKGDYSQDKIAAYQTLYECLTAMSKMMSPLAPFFADWLYGNLNKATKLEDHPSVHLSFFPVADLTKIDEDLEIRMDYAQRLSSMVLSLRKKEKIRVRQPLPRVLIPIIDSRFQGQVEQISELVLAEVNVKKLEFVQDASGVIKKKAKPNFKSLGKRLGAHMKEANKIISTMTQEEIADFEQQGFWELEIDGAMYKIKTEDITISSEDIPGWQVASDGNLTVALDTHLTDTLRAEGMARELVNRIQNMRKTKDFNVTDKIEIFIQPHDTIHAALNLYGDYIREETLAKRIVEDEDLNGELVQLVDDVAIRMDIVQS